MLRDAVACRRPTARDVPDLAALEVEVWGDLAAGSEMLEQRIANCPEGNLMAVDHRGRCCGAISACRINYETYHAAGRCTWYHLSGNGTASTHTLDGPDLFGINLGVAAWAPRPTSRLLLAALTRVGVRWGVRRGILGARLPGYRRRSTEMSAEHYVTLERSPGLPLDPELQFYIRAGFRPLQLVPHYFQDPESRDYGMLMVRENPFGRSAWHRLAGRVLVALPIDVAAVTEPLQAKLDGTVAISRGEAR